jgi:hypothetical protein
MADEMDIPEELMEEHMKWHLPKSQGGTRRYDVGDECAGLEFLNFHKDFIRKVLLSYSQRGETVPVWDVWVTRIPSFLKSSNLGWTSDLANSEERIVNSLSTFTNADTLGTYIEGTVHGWLHLASGTYFDDDNVKNFRMSPMSPYFYSIHMLIEGWWFRWIQAQTPPTPWYPCQSDFNRIRSAQQNIESLQQDMFSATPQQKAYLRAQLDAAQAALAQAEKEWQHCLRFGDTPPDIRIVMGDAMENIATFTSELRKKKTFAKKLMSAMKECDSNGVREVCMSIGIENVHFEPFNQSALMVPPARHICLLLQGHMLAFPVESQSSAD